MRHSITAIITDRRGHVLSVGNNSYVKTHPLQYKHAVKMDQPHRVFLHAEIHAITRCKDLNKAWKISVFRYDKHGSPRLAKPCTICESAIEAAGINNVEYT